MPYRQTLKPRINFHASLASARVLKEEEPFSCIRCGKPFGVKSTIERIIATLEGRQSMYKDAHGPLDAIKMCDVCRVAAISEQGFDPRDRAPPRSMEDYLREPGT